MEEAWSKKEMGFHNFMLGAKMTTKVLLDCLLCEMPPSPLHQFMGDLTMTRLALFPLNSLMAGFPGCHYQGGGDDGAIGWAQWGEVFVSGEERETTESETAPTATSLFSVCDFRSQ